MRAGFILAVLFVAAAYTFVAFRDLSYLSSAGRLGPGFFPRIIGASLVALCLYSLYADRRRQHPQDAASAFGRTAIAVGLLSAVFVALLDVLGGLLSMVAFMLAALAFLNPGRWLQNGLLAAILPLAIFLMFRVWLNAALPRGMLPLPF